MQKTAYLRLIILILLISLIAFGCTSAPQNQPAPDSAQSQGNATDNGASVTLKLAHELADDHPWGAAANKFKEIVEKETNGAITVEIYGNGQLGASGREIQESVMIGSLECGVSSTPMEILNPYMKLFALPYVFANVQEAWQILDGPVGDAVAAYAEDSNVKVLAYWEDGMRQITNNTRPIYVPEDLKGVKLRVPESTVRLATFEALGASPVSMPFSEVFTSLQQGTIDGQENPLSVVSTSSFYECQKYLSITNHVYSAACLLINLDLWNTLSAEQQEILIQAAQEARDINRQLNEENDNKLLAELESLGMAVNEIADVGAFQDAMQPVWDSVLNELGDDGRDLFEQMREQQGQ